MSFVTSYLLEQMPQRSMQSTQELILVERTKDFPHVAVKYGWELMDFFDESASSDNKHSQHPITALLKNVSTDEKVYVRASYIVGCDGPSSTVAKKLNVS
jgi:2-polyprenyl-6-methoxyphenol hydroxylase-like FAD-dependent oxidoreductase